MTAFAQDWGRQGEEMPLPSIEGCIRTIGLVNLILLQDEEVLGPVNTMRMPSYFQQLGSAVETVRVPALVNDRVPQSSPACAPFGAADKL